MKIKCWYLSLILIGQLLVMTLTTGPVFSSSRFDPWYSDLPTNYWAYKEIRSLWSEEVTDGFVYEDYLYPDDTFARFLPKSECSRGQFIMMFAKIFQLPQLFPVTPSFIDVPVDFSLYFNKPAFPYIEAANAAGLLSASPGGYLYPDAPLTREGAAVKLIKSLGLKPYAMNISNSEANEILAPFVDSDSISISARNYLAAAVQLKILYGYGDDIREIRPQRILSRDEAAVILYRSCLVRVQADPPIFNPYQDGEFDRTKFRFESLKNRNVTHGTLKIISKNFNQVLKEFSFSDFKKVISSGADWNGEDDQGNLLDPGTYFFFCTFHDRHGNAFSSSRKPIVIDKKSLDASLHPQFVKPLQNLTVVAITDSDVIAVTAHFENQSLSLQKNSIAESSKDIWVCTYTVPADALESGYLVTVEAHYPFIVISTDLIYHVIDPISLTGIVYPRQVRAGEVIHVEAQTSDNVIKVDAVFSFSPPLSLSPVNYSSWHGKTNIPTDTLDGLYQVHFRAESPNKTVWYSTHFEVIGSILNTYDIFLSD